MNTVNELPDSLLDVLGEIAPRASAKYFMGERLINLAQIETRDQYGDEWEDQRQSERSQDLIPRNLDLWLPADPLTDQEPYNIQQWVFSKDLGLDWFPQLLFVMAVEVELIIGEAQTITIKRERGLYIANHIRMMLIGATYHFTDKKESKAALIHINEWRNYFHDTAGCYSKGQLDRQAAAINNLNREVTA
jgi:hypothetical protein